MHPLTESNSSVSIVRHTSMSILVKADLLFQLLSPTLVALSSPISPKAFMISEKIASCSHQKERRICMD